jgi:hypothetical protein
MVIHTVGDSHSKFGWKNVVCHHIGSVLCYSFGKENLARCDISKFDLKNDDTIIFCFGEIDCRCHIHKHVNKNNSYKDIIDSIIENYFDAIDKNIENLNVTLKNICVYNVVPPVEKKNTAENKDSPYLGTDEERKMYTLYFNKQLKIKCAKKQYIFFDIYDKYTDVNGFLSKKLSDNLVHILDGIYLDEFIELYLT